MIFYVTHDSNKETETKNYSLWKRHQAANFDAYDGVPFTYEEAKKDVCTAPLYFFYKYRFLSSIVYEDSSIWQVFYVFGWDTWLSILLLLLLLHSLSHLTRFLWDPTRGQARTQGRPQQNLGFQNCLTQIWLNWLTQIWYWLPHFVDQGTSRLGQRAFHVSWIFFLIIAVELFRSDLYANIVTPNLRELVDSMQDVLRLNKTPHFPFRTSMDKLLEISKNIETQDPELAKTYKSFYNRSLKYYSGHDSLSYQFLLDLFKDPSNIDDFLAKGVLVTEDESIVWLTKIFAILGIPMHASEKMYVSQAWTTQCFGEQYARFDTRLEIANDL